MGDRLLPVDAIEGGPFPCMASGGLGLACGGYVVASEAPAFIARPDDVRKQDFASNAGSGLDEHGGIRTETMLEPVVNVPSPRLAAHAASKFGL
jgi:hypothetical protein